MLLPILIRDPIHGSIKIIYNEERKILDSPYFQRLRHVSQLAGAQLVYPSATHTRFAHSLGTMHIAGLYASQLFPDDENRIKIIRLSALLHDIAHGPFSHQFDDAVYSKYFKEVKKVKEEILSGHDYQRITVLKRLLEENYIDEDTYNGILDIWQEKDSIGYAIVQGVMGADRLDFLLRDSYYSGTQHFGSVPLDRIVNNTYIKEYNGQKILCYSYKLIDDLYTALIGRFFMYRNVYFHKAARSADILIQHMLEEAANEFNLYEWISDLDKFKYLNEYVVTGLIFAKGSKKLRKLYTRIFYNRDLLKMVHEFYEPPFGIDLHDLRRDFLKRYLERKYIIPIQEMLGKDVPIVPDTLLDLTFFNPTEFTASNVYIYDPKHRIPHSDEDIVTMEFALERLKYLPFAKGFGIMRLYTEAQHYNEVKKKILEISASEEKSISTRA
ncbi:MAG: HD domain-containing protein [Candidatus Asgardarchaeia archaeon]